MKIKQISLINYRNYNNCCLVVKDLVNVLYGNNAQGKTNLLEGIYYAAFGSSHRTSSEEDLVSLEATGMSAEVIFDNNFGENKIKLKRQVIQGKTKKEIFFNDNPVKPKEHYGLLNVVLFSPEDLQLVKGEPSLRRRFFDMEIAQVNSLYYSLLVKYNRVVQQRNKLLKEAREKNLDEKLLLVWDKELAVTAAKILAIRLKVLEKISVLTEKTYSAITGKKEHLTIQYELKGNNGQLFYPEEKSVSAWESWYLENLAARRFVDKMRGNTGIGPHRDDLLIKVNDKPLRSFGSQGQQRSGALALKMAELEYLREEKGEYPILLLDDVMSELDSSRREQILSFIDGRVQTFITVNDKTLIPELGMNQYFYVEAGKICED